MAKKIGLLLAAVAVLAFAVPAMASASTGLTSPSGTLVPVGTLITGKSSSSTITSSKLGSLTCTNVELRGKVTKNNASEGVEGVGSGTSTASSCKTPSGAEFKVSEIVLKDIKSPASTPGKGTASFSFTATLPGPQVCKYEATNDAGTYAANTPNITLEKAPLTVVSGTNCGTSTLDATFALSLTSGGNAVIIM